MSDDTPWYAPNHQPSSPRQREAGEEVWRLHEPATGRVMSCEMLDQADVGAGFDVRLRLDDELLFSRRCTSRSEAATMAETIADGPSARWLETMRRALADCQTGYQRCSRLTVQSGIFHVRPVRCGSARGASRI